jgi:putative exporter of polyketide antibiotics
MNRFALTRKTLRDARGTAIGIGLITAAIAVLDLAVYPSYKESLASFEVPEAFKGFLGEATDISSPAGFLTAEFFSWVPLLLVTLAIVAGTAAFAGEEGAGTLDLLLAQPVKRWRVVVEKTAALTIAVVLCALAGLAGFLVGRHRDRNRAVRPRDCEHGPARTAFPDGESVGECGAANAGSGGDPPHRFSDRHLLLADPW